MTDAIYNLPEDVVALARRVVAANLAAGRSLALAESCTGGMVAAAITEIAGSSAVFECSFVTYSNNAKQKLLGVAGDIIETFGAVSPACAWAMAQGALKHSTADVAVAISGIAGPDGGTAQKPVGLVVFARATRGNPEVVAEEHRFDDTGRTDIRRQAALVALELLMPPEAPPEA